MGLFYDLNKQGMTLIVVTHDNDIARQAERIVTLRDGKIIGDERNGHTVLNPTDWERSKGHIETNRTNDAVVNGTMANGELANRELVISPMSLLSTAIDERI